MSTEKCDRCGNTFLTDEFGSTTSVFPNLVFSGPARFKQSDGSLFCIICEEIRLKRNGEKCMKLFLDDIRESNKHLCFKDPFVFWTFLKDHWDHVAEISLDHDLGIICNGKETTGYDVLCWIEEEVISQDKGVPFEIFVHSANPVGRNRMASIISKLKENA